MSKNITSQICAVVPQKRKNIVSFSDVFDDKSQQDILKINEKRWGGCKDSMMWELPGVVGVWIRTWSRGRRPGDCGRTGPAWRGPWTDLTVLAPSQLTCLVIALRSLLCSGVAWRLQRLGPACRPARHGPPCSPAEAPAPALPFPAQHPTSPLQPCRFLWLLNRS